MFYFLLIFNKISVQIMILVFICDFHWPINFVVFIKAFSDFSNERTDMVTNKLFERKHRL